MLNLSRDIRSLSDFKRNTSDCLEQMEETGNPIVLTINGRAKLVVQDAAAYQQLIEASDHADALRGIRDGLNDVAAGRTQPAAAAFAAIRKKHNIPTRKKT